MAIDKETFAKYIVNALEEIKNISSASEPYDSFVMSGDNPDALYSKYVENLSVSKVLKLYSLISELALKKVNSISDEEIESYRNEKLGLITEKINRYTVGYIYLTSDQDKEKLNTEVDSLMEEHRKIKDMPKEEIKKQLIRKFSSIVPKEELEENKMFANMSKDKETLTKFLNLLNRYKSLNAEIKSMNMERAAISLGLTRTVYNFNIPGMDEKALFTDEGLASLKNSASSYIQNAVNEAEIERRNFSSKSKEFYEIITNDKYKSNEVEPYTFEALNYYRDKMDPILYERAVLQIKEWSRLDKKLFKAKEDNNRLKQLKSEIDSTKHKIGLAIRQSYRNHYNSNSVYMPIASTVDGKFVYAVGQRSLSQFFYLGEWPTDDEIKMLSLTRELNRKEAENYIIKVEIAKERFSYLNDSSMNNKTKELEKIRSEIVSLVGSEEKVLRSGILDDEVYEEVDRTVPIREIDEISKPKLENISESKKKELVEKLNSLEIEEELKLKGSK